MENNLETLQKEICTKYGSEFKRSDLSLKVGVSLGVKDNQQPILEAQRVEHLLTPAFKVILKQKRPSGQKFLPRSR